MEDRVIYIHEDIYWALLLVLRRSRNVSIYQRDRIR